MKLANRSLKEYNMRKFFDYIVKKSQKNKGIMPGILMIFVENASVRFKELK